jgi:hypothetical protein
MLWLKKSKVFATTSGGRVEDREGEIKTGLTVVAAAALWCSAVIHCEARERLIQTLRSGRSA